MLFDDILETLKANGGSVLAYEKTILRADAAMSEDPQRAIAYRMLSALAERYIESTGRLPVTKASTENAFKAFEAVVNELQNAYAGGSAESVLATLNKTAITSREQLDLIEKNRD